MDEVVADTTVIPPRHPAVLALSTPIPFHNFRYPHVNAAEDVTFIADDRNADAPQHGIYRSLAATKKLQPLAAKGQPLADDSSVRFDYIRGLQMDGDDFVFNATLTDDGRGLFHWSNGRISTIARTGRTALPGQLLPLTEVEYGALKDGRVLYQATDAAGKALVLFDVKSKQTRVILRTGLPIPDRGNDLFLYFSPQNWIDADNVVFRAARVIEPHDRQSKQRGNVGVYGWFGVDWKKPEAFAPNKLVTVADWTTPVPADQTGRFMYFGSAPVDRGRVAFKAEVSGSARPKSGIYVADSAGGLRNIVDTDSEMDELFQGPFTDFSKWVELLDGKVLFIGYAEGGRYVGVFVYKPERDEIFLLCDNRETIDGKDVANFEIASNFLVRNRLAVTINFRDRSSGVYLATIPARAFRRMR